MSTLAGLDPANRATLYGSEGTLCFEGNDLFMGVRGDETMSPVSIPEAEQGHWRVEDDFIEAVRGQREVTLTDFETGVAYMEFTDAVWRSMAEGRSVSLPKNPAEPGRGEQ